MNQYGYFQDGQGHKSMGRLLLFISQMAGVLVIVAGVGVFVAAFVLRYGEALGHATALTGMGVGVEAGSVALKNWGKHEER